MSIVIDEEDDIEYDENPDQEADIDDTDSSFYDDSPSENEMDQSAYCLLYTSRCV